jgi:trehalose 2-sulfotransferase
MRPARYNELDVDGDAFDCPPCALQKKIFICSAPRTGSYLLCRAMIHCGMGVPHEYFHRLHIPMIGPRCGLPALADADRFRSDRDLRRAYIAAIQQRRTVHGIFSAKVHGGEFSAYLDNDEGMQLFQDGHFIYLYREDLLGQAISRHVAWLTGRWGNDDTVTTPPAADPDFFDNGRIIRHANEISREDASWRLFFVQNGITPLVLTYERLSGDISGTLRAIAGAFQLEVPAGGFEYADPPREPGAEGPSRSAIRERFLELNRRFVPATRPDQAKPAS